MREGSLDVQLKLEVGPRRIARGERDGFGVGVGVLRGFSFRGSHFVLLCGKISIALGCILDSFRNTCKWVACGKVASSRLKC